MVETHLRPEERGENEAPPDDEGLFTPEDTEGLPVVDVTGRRVGSLTEGWVLGGGIERITFRVDAVLREKLGLPEVVDVEATWLERGEDFVRLTKRFESALVETGFDL